MCGISGVFHYNNDRRIDPNLLKKMNDVLSHRGPDGEGTYLDQNIGLAHRRLSIIDIASGAQPMFNTSRSIVIVFNGEIYNYKELRKVLEKKGHKFKTHSDTESIIHLYEEEGIGCVNRLRGMFAFALWDKDNQTLLLARDRLGIKPLYYSFLNNSLSFASEIKAILQDNTLQRTIDYETMSNYFSFLVIPSPKTIYKGIYKLPAGHIMVVRPRSYEIRKYWDISYDNTLNTYNESDFIDETINILEEVVKLHMISDVPLGAFLSGGIDSSVIATIMQNISNKPITTCTIGFPVSEFDESEYAKNIANIIKSNHHEHFVQPDITKIINKLIWHLDEPFADSSAIPTYYVCKMARKNVTVALSGDGGDELFAGYNSYVRTHFEEKLRNIPKLLRGLFLPPVLAMMPQLMRGRTLLANLSETRQRAFFNKSCYFTHEMKESLFSYDLKQKIKNLDSFSVMEPFFRDKSHLDIIAQCQYTDIKNYLVDDILTKVDKMSMANSLEVRPPFLDHVFVEYVSKIPTQMKLNSKSSKYLLKKIKEKLLPVDAFKRKKQGFRIPIGEWMKSELKKYAEDILFDSKTIQRGYFNTKYIQKLWKIHNINKKGAIYIPSHLWSIITFELWNREFIDC